MRARATCCTCEEGPLTVTVTGLYTAGCASYPNAVLSMISTCTGTSFDARVSSVTRNWGRCTSRMPTCGSRLLTWTTTSCWPGPSPVRSSVARKSETVRSCHELRGARRRSRTASLLRSSTTTRFSPRPSTDTGTRSPKSCTTSGFSWSMAIHQTASARTIDSSSVAMSGIRNSVRAERVAGRVLVTLSVMLQNRSR